MKNISFYILSLLSVLMLASCSKHEGSVAPKRSIQFVYQIESLVDSRAFAKDYFYDGDRIYISATFTLDNGSTKKDEVATVLNGIISTTMEWPEDATEATFTAWFASNDLPDDTGIITTSLHQDILKTVATANSPDVPIKLDFQHSLIRVVVSGILKDETLTVSSPSGTDGVVAFDTRLLDSDPLVCSENGVSVTLSANDNIFYLQQWTQSLTLQSNKGTEEQVITCPSNLDPGKSYHIILRP